MARPGRAWWSRLEVVRSLEAALIRTVPRDHLESDRAFRRRRVVVAVLRDHVNDVLDHARYSLLPVVAVITVVNGVAEELFFPGALHAAIGRRYPVLVSTGLYALTTVASARRAHRCVDVTAWADD